jgi:alanyl-tRNA synthetase
MTKLLYYIDPYMKEFDANVIKLSTDETGRYVVVDKTAFYPTGGGQPFDTGTLNDFTVLQVEKVDDEVRHYLAEGLDADTKVRGKIDWDRRFDHMQQHCGQHILSATFEELFDIETVGFHLGTEGITIDLKTSDLTQEIIERVERRANEVVFVNRSIDIKWINQEELKNYPIRKMPTVTENIRLVIIPEFDYNGCGGTHPKTTGEVGPIKIFGWEKNRGNVRLQFACGFRAINELHQKQLVLQEITALLRTSDREAPQKLSQILASHLALEKDIAVLNDQLLEHEAKELVREITGKTYVIAKHFNGRAIKELQELARKIVESNTEKIVIFVTKVEARLQMVCASGSAIEIDMNMLLKESLQLIDGKGGGKRNFAQGGGSATVLATELMDKALEILNNF